MNDPGMNDARAAGKRQLVEILLVEDNPSDVLLTQIAMKQCKIVNNLHVAEDGEEALAFLRREGKHAGAPRPDLVLLDLNLPRMDGREVLATIKSDVALRTIPVVVLTTSDAERDVTQSYALHANAYITKPVDITQFVRVVRSLDDFWFGIVRLTQRSEQE
jgi:two-component system, chemotaxis family, response regulator Rcp1